MRFFENERLSSQDIEEGPRPPSVLLYRTAPALVIKGRQIRVGRDRARQVRTLVMMFIGVEHSR